MVSNCYQNWGTPISYRVVCCRRCRKLLHASGDLVMLVDKDDMGEWLSKLKLTTRWVPMWLLCTAKLFISIHFHSSVKNPLEGFGVGLIQTALGQLRLLPFFLSFGLFWFYRRKAIWWIKPIHGIDYSNLTQHVYCDDLYSYLYLYPVQFICIYIIITIKSVSYTKGRTSALDNCTMQKFLTIGMRATNYW